MLLAAKAPTGRWLCRSQIDSCRLMAGRARRKRTGRTPGRIGTTGETAGHPRAKGETRPLTQSLLEHCRVAADAIKRSRLLHTAVIEMDVEALPFFEGRGVSISCWPR